MRRSGSSGFSVIEALVAVAILAIALVPLLSLQIQVQRNFQREREARLEIADQRNALALLRDMNMMQSPNGQIALSRERVLIWRATPISRETQTIARGANAFAVALYRVDVEVRGPRGRRLSGFRTEQLGWRATSATRENPDAISPRR